MKNVLVVAAHPDDEVLGCGGIIAKHVEKGDTVTVVTFTDGVSSRINAVSEAEREHEFIGSSNILGYKFYKFIQIGYDDQELDIVPILHLTRDFERFSPDIIYTHYAHDLNQDHRQLYHATMIAFRPKPGQTCKEIYCYQVPSYGNTTFNPNLYVQLTYGQAMLKLKALECYKSVLTQRFNRESICRIMQECGNSIGVEYAEAFEIARIVK